VCGPADNLLVYANYDGGPITINVDQNLPNIGIGILSDNASTVTISGPYAGNVVAVYVVGGSGASSTVTGAGAAPVTKLSSPPVTLSVPGAPTVMYYEDKGGALLDPYGSCNTREQVRDYFVQKMGGSIKLHACQYNSYGSVNVSAGGTCACTPLKCSDVGKNCGTLPDGCGGTLNCGACADGSICGGFDAPNVCGACAAGDTFAGPFFPSTVVSSSGIGSYSWQNPQYAKASDNSYAEVSAMTGGASNWLKATGFGFQIPPDATIHGVYVEWERSALSGGTTDGLVDNAVRLVVGGTIGTTDRAKPDVWWRAVGGVDRKVLYGGATDLWGEAGLTPAVVGASDFGAALSVKYTSSAGNDWPMVDAARMYVCYRTP
jgi:hypothetical protein